MSQSSYNEEFNEEEYGRCQECSQINTYYLLCHACNSKRFQQNFKNWTSYNKDIDKFIQKTQLSSMSEYKALEWIPYDRFYDIKYVAKGGFGTVYKAKWIDGYICEWDGKIQNWNRTRSNEFVALKSFNNSKNDTLEFINEITLHQIMIKDCMSSYIQVYGITQEPITKNYMIVMEYAEHGSLRNYLDLNNLNWKDRIHELYDIATGLAKIHEKGLIHQCLHIGNVLKFSYKTCITGMKSVYYKNTESNIYGVLPYMAPEILQGPNYTKAADIYSFGIIMYEVISGLPPYHNVAHNKNLASSIYQGHRPTFDIKVPQLILNLIRRCLDANLLNRPTSQEIREIFKQWEQEINFNANDPSELIKQIKEAEEINKNLSTNQVPSTQFALIYEIHSEAIYTSRLFNFNYPSEQKHSDDDYMDYSESLQIDISQLKISDADEMEGIE